MLDLYAELRRIVQVLDTAEITYASWGGLAVSIYTRPRATEDIDLLMARDDVERATAALEPLGFRPLKRLRGSARDRADLEALGPEEL